MSLYPLTVTLNMASHFSDVGTSLEDDRERDAVADCTVVGGMHRLAEAGILSEVDVSHPIPMVAVFDRPMTAVPCKQFSGVPRSFGTEVMP